MHNNLTLNELYTENVTEMFNNPVTFDIVLRHIKRFTECYLKMFKHF